MNCRPPCFLDVDWERSMGSSVSLVPSESLSLTDIGQLGRICSSGEITPQSQYITDLNSPPELHLSITDHHHQQQLDNGGLPVPGNPMLVPHLTPFSVDPRFVDRTAMFSSFGGGRNCGGLAAQFGLLEAGKLSTDASCRSLGTNRSQMGVSGKYKEIPMLDGPQLEMGSGDFGNAREESSVSDPISAGESNPRKRKAIPKSKAKGHAKITEGDDSMAKRCRSAEFTRTEKDEIKPKIEQNGDHEQKQRKGDNVKPIDPPKQDFIHVRARRGEATDSHSLAERVRREKISERMKLLQDLVPGCNKVTGKALMLDEIINYVQSLQQQVEFLSMKLASVNPQLGFNMESHLPRDIHQVIGSSTNSVYPAFSDARQPQQGTSLQCVASNGLETRCSANPLEPTLHQSLSMQLPSLDRVGYATSQLGTFWENDFQNVAQLGFHDPFHVAHMKTER